MLRLVLRWDEVGPSHKNILGEGEAVAPALGNFFPASAVEGKSSGGVGRGEAWTAAGPAARLQDGTSQPALLADAQQS